MKYLRNSELIKELQKHDPDLPVIIEHNESNCLMAIEDLNISVINYHRDSNTNYNVPEAFEYDEQFLLLASI